MAHFSHDFRAKKTYPGIMKWMEVKVVYTSSRPEVAGELIADLFYGLGVQGVVVEDPLAEGDPDWGKDAVPMPSDHAVSGYFPINTAYEQRRLALAAGIRQLESRFDVSTVVRYRAVDEEDWAESWKSFFWPEKLTDRIVVKPTWRTYAPSPGDVIIEIDPGMAFGSGTHPTTAMCVQLIQTHLKPGDHFLDVGTGSGILMVAAAKLGAALGQGIDNDPVAVDVARSNLQLNGLDAQQFSVAVGDLVTSVDRRFDLVTANILSEVIIDLLDPLRNVLAGGATAIFSGIIAANAPAVLEAMARYGYEVCEQITRDDWVAIVASRPHRVRKNNKNNDENL